MDQQGSGRACIFCGATEDLTKEHLWPDWLNKELPNIYTSTVTLTRPDGETRSWAERETASQEIATVCGDCNHGWMNDLEKAARPILVPMLNGRRLPLDRPQQRTLAAWAFKRATVAEYLDPPNAVIPFEERSWLKGHEKPPKGAHVFITSLDARLEETLYLNTYRLLPETPNNGDANLGRKGYVATLAIQHLALQVIFWREFKHTTLVHQAPLAQSVQRIWPFDRNFGWPPGPVLPVPGFRAFRDAWRRP
jgi:hypothetical protein